VGPLESEWRTGVRHPGRVGKSMGKSRHNHSRPSVGQVATIENHRRLAHREIGNPGDMMFKHFEFAIREIPDEWGPAVITAEEEDRGVVEASCQPTGESGYRDFRGQGILA
jgi:hypothetical protein